MEEFKSWTSILETLRTPALALAYSCIIEKEINFTHLNHKTFHISHSKTVYIYIFTTITVHIYTITIAVLTIILLISQFRTFFLLSFLHVQNELNLRLLLSSSFFFPLRYTQTQTHPHKHIHTDKSTLRYTNAHT